VLVGGQSLTAWVEYYRIKLPSFEGPYSTIDADFLGTRTEAEVIARELGSKAQIPTIDDQTPNAAAIDFAGASGKKLHYRDRSPTAVGLRKSMLNPASQTPLEWAPVAQNRVPWLHPRRSRRCRPAR